MLEVFKNQGTIDEFITKLSTNSRNVNQKTWSLEELQLMKVYAQIQNHQEEVSPGIERELKEKERIQTFLLQQDAKD